jgi:hypothetical protein
MGGRGRRGRVLTTDLHEVASFTRRSTIRECVRAWSPPTTLNSQPCDAIPELVILMKQRNHWRRCAGVSGKAKSVVLKSHQVAQLHRLSSI